MRPQIESAVVDRLLDTGRPPFKIIDTHGHMGNWAGIWFPNPDPADMIRTMDRCGVERLVFAHHDALQDPDSGNRKAQEAVRAHPDRFLGYCAVNPNYPEQLKRAVDGFADLDGFVGYKILAGYYGTPIDLPACRPMWEHADANGLVVLLHTWGGDSHADCGKIRKIVDEFPNVTILMGHSQHGYWDEAIRCARDLENVYCELTAAYSVGGVVQKMVDAGIEDKITFGTDLPWFDPMHGIGCVVFANITDTACRKILRDNALRIFGTWL